MTRRSALSPLLVVAWLVLLVVPVSAATGDPIRVELDKTHIELGIGEGFRFTSTITNESDQALDGIVAHLNIASADGSTYVDPEDWSSRRTQYLDTLAPHTSQQIEWSVHAVNGGPLIIYVAVTTRAGPDVVAASQPLRATVTAIRTIDASGVLPVAISVPAIVLAGLAIVTIRRRRLA